MKLVIVGNGVAGMKIAEDVRKYSSAIEIDIYNDEKYGYYSRVWLPEIISGGKTPESIVMHDAKWYKSKRIGYHPETRISAIDPKERTIAIDPGKIFPYDKLCICTGASCNIPPIKNANIKGVFTLRTIDDALMIKDYIKGKKKAS